VNKNQPSWKRDRFNVVSEWITADDPVSSVTNVTGHGLLDKDGWDHFHSPTKRDKLTITSTLVEEGHPAIDDSKWDHILGSKPKTTSTLVEADHPVIENVDDDEETEHKDPGNKNQPSWKRDRFNVASEWITAEDPISGVQVGTTHGESKKTGVYHLVYAGKHDGRHKVRLRSTTHGEPKMTRVHLMYAGTHDGRHKARFRSLLRQGDTTTGLLMNENSTSPNTILSGSLGSDNFPRSFRT
jgi:hypothetical protein